MCVWAGLWMMAGPAVWARFPWTVASPLFTFYLLRFLSGELFGGIQSLSKVAPFPSFKVDRRLASKIPACLRLHAGCMYNGCMCKTTSTHLLPCRHPSRLQK